jgi:hypothetical protein
MCLFLASCGLGGDDGDGEDDPTPTETASSQLEPQDQPIESPESETGTPEETFVLIPPSPDATVTEPAEADATADAGTPVRTGPALAETDDATPEATPEATEDSDEADTSSEVAPTLPANAVTGSDGTSGPEGAAGLLDESNATPVATPALENVTEVDSCDVVDAPPFQGEDANYTPIEEVNFRVGPGADCESVLDGPLTSGVEMTVLSEPVVRSDDEERVLWVQVEVDGDIGWVAAEFIEPAG